MRTIALITALLVLATAPVAQAGTREDPEIVDACGIGPDTPAHEISAGAVPWADICAGWVETLTGEAGPPAIRITLEYAGDISERPVATRYWMSFSIGDCRYHVEHDDAGNHLVGVRCGPSSVPEECPPFDAVIQCSRANPPILAEAVDGVIVEDGNRLVVTLVFDGALAEWADDFAEGSVLEDLYTSAHGLSQADGGAICYGLSCMAVGGDWAYGRDYTVEAGAGPAVTGPVIPAPTPPQCLAGPATDGSADRPHLADEEGDRRSTLTTSLPSGEPVVVPDPEGAAYDLKAAWFSDAGGGQLAFSIQPWGPSHVPGELGYMLRLGDWLVDLSSNADGSWSGVYEPNGLLLHPDELDDHRAVEVSADADTGVVTVVLPEEVVPDGDIVVDHVSSRYSPSGPAGAPPTLRATTSVDTSDNSDICAATR